MLSRRAVAGDIWFPGGARTDVALTSIAGDFLDRRTYRGALYGGPSASRVGGALLGSDGVLGVGGWFRSKGHAGDEGGQKRPVAVCAVQPWEVTGSFDHLELTHPGR